MPGLRTKGIVGAIQTALDSVFPLLAGENEFSHGFLLGFALSIADSVWIIQQLFFPPLSVLVQGVFDAGVAEMSAQFAMVHQLSHA